MTEVKSTFKSTNFEHEIMLCLLENKKPLFDELRYQYRNASILRREKSIFSAITYYIMPSGIKPIKFRNLTVGSLKAEVMECQDELSIKLFVRNGFLSHMEITEDNGKLPQMPSLLTVYRDEAV
ncbi:MAG: hypothetical protein NE334_17940 [Lentisphaeraceae bacterium]|nr:hypothetical protein [Lentisphaeraceae bacterium]